MSTQPPLGILWQEPVGRSLWGGSGQEQECSFTRNTHLPNEPFSFRVGECFPLSASYSCTYLCINCLPFPSSPCKPTPTTISTHVFLMQLQEHHSPSYFQSGKQTGRESMTDGVHSSISEAGLVPPKSPSNAPPPPLFPNRLFHSSQVLMTACSSSPR